MLKEIRKKRNLTRKKLGEKTNISYRTIESYENNLRDINNANFMQIVRLADELECKLEDIVTDKETIKMLKKIYK